MVVHPFLDGPSLGEHGEYTTASERFAVLELLIDLHAATDVAARHADIDDLALPHREDFRAALAQVSSPWDAGPYGERARDLLSANEHSLRTLMAVYERLATEVGSRQNRVVLTHGEPHAGNVLNVNGRYLLIDGTPPVSLRPSGTYGTSIPAMGQSSRPTHRRPGRCGP